MTENIRGSIDILIILTQPVSVSTIKNIRETFNDIVIPYPKCDTLEGAR